MADENQIKIVGVKTANQLNPTSSLTDNTQFVCSNGSNESELKKIAYSTIKTNINTAINEYAYSKTDTSSSSELNTEFAKYQLTSGMSNYLLIETANDSYAPKAPEGTSYFTLSAAELSVDNIIDMIKTPTIPAATSSNLGGIKLYSDTELDQLNNNQFNIKIQDNTYKAYVELSTSKLNEIVADLNSITAITKDINDITSNVKDLSDSISELDSESINKAISQIQQISSDALDLVETNAYMFGTYTRNLYLGLDADSDVLFRQLSAANILSILIVNNEIDQIRLNNLVVTYTLTSTNQNSINYTVEASTYDNDNPELTSGPITYTETNEVSALKLASDNKLIWLYSKINEYTFISNDIQLTDAIRFLKDDIFTTTFTYNSKDDKYEARLMFDDYALGEYNGYVFKQISSNKTNLDSLSSGDGIFYENVCSTLSGDFVHVNDTRTLNNLSISNGTFSVSSANNLKIGSTAIGSTTQPVYVNQNGNLEACTGSLDSQTIDLSCKGFQISGSGGQQNHTVSADISLNGYKPIAIAGFKNENADGNMWGTWNGGYISNENNTDIVTVSWANITTSTITFKGTVYILYIKSTQIHTM